MLAGEQPAGKRVVWNDGELVFLAQRQQLALDLAKKQVVARLHRDELRQAERFAAAERARHAVRVVVGAADVARFARAQHGVESLQRLVMRGGGVVKMHLVQVDVVGA